LSKFSAFNDLFWSFVFYSFLIIFWGGRIQFNFRQIFKTYYLVEYARWILLHKQNLKNCANVWKNSEIINSYHENELVENKTRQLNWIWTHFQKLNGLIWQSKWNLKISGKIKPSNGNSLKWQIALVHFWWHEISFIWSELRILDNYFGRSTCKHFESFSSLKEST
jgi:hypothetical protein